MKDVNHEVNGQADLDDDLDTLLSLQGLEGDIDQGFVQMFSCTSCVATTCGGS